MKIRKPAVVGQFYEADKDGLTRQIRSCFESSLGPKKLPPAPSDSSHSHTKCFILPHAGYMYSGPVAAHGYYLASSMRGVKTAIVAGPNHYGIGTGVSTLVGWAWETPLGTVPVDDEVASFLIKDSGIIDVDPDAHYSEHSIEVHVPFLQFIFGSRIRIVPICMLLQDVRTAKELGESIAKVFQEDRDNSVLFIASSDLTHYEPQEQAKKVDSEFIRGGALAPSLATHYAFLERLSVSACGFGPMGVAIRVAEVLGLVPRLLKYGTSGDVTGDKSSVVGYSSIAYSSPS